MTLSWDVATAVIFATAFHFGQWIYLKQIRRIVREETFKAISDFVAKQRATEVGKDGSTTQEGHGSRPH